MGEHIGADHLKAFHRHTLLFLLLFHRLAFKLSLDSFFHLAQLPCNPLDPVIVRQPGNPASAIRHVLILQIRLQLAFRQAHGDAADPVILVRLIPGPGTVDGNIPGQCAVIDHHHGKVAAFMPILVTVQDALGGVPLGTGDDSVMMPRLVILVLLSVVPFGLVIMEVWRPGLAGKDIATVPFIPQHGADPALCPAGIRLSVDLSLACLPPELSQGGSNLRDAAAVEKHVVHEPDSLRLILIDLQHLLMTAVTIGDLYLVVSQQGGRHKPPSAEAPFQGEQHGLTLHMALFFRDHRQDEENDVAGGVQRVQVLLLKEHRDRRIMLLELMQSSRFLAKRLTLLVMIMSIFPARASFIMSLKAGR